jgi:hypothetical protein
MPLLVRICQFWRLHPLDPNIGFAHDQLEDLRQPSDPLDTTAPSRFEILDPPLIRKTFTYMYYSRNITNLAKFYFPLPRDQASRSQIWQIISEQEYRQRYKIRPSNF